MKHYIEFVLPSLATVLALVASSPTQAAPLGACDSKISAAASSDCALGRAVGSSRLLREPNKSGSKLSLRTTGSREAGSGEGTARKKRVPAVRSAADPKPAGSPATEVTSSRFLTTSELQEMYGGRTWVWSNGGGYFDPSGRFSAAAGTNAASATIARGSWRAGSQGELCFQAVWSAQTGQNDQRTCFYHLLQGDTVYQKKGPTGEWFAFKSSPARRGDEANKFRDGDQISGKISDLRSRYLYGIAFF
jgi:hypothetical protein